MSLPSKKVLRSEFIGLPCEVVNSSNKNLVGIKGKIIDESQNTFIILTINGNKRVLKNTCKFLITVNENQYTINGSHINKRPQERIMLR